MSTLSHSSRNQQQSHRGWMLSKAMVALSSPGGHAATMPTCGHAGCNSAQHGTAQHSSFREESSGEVASYTASCILGSFILDLVLNCKLMQSVWYCQWHTPARLGFIPLTFTWRHVFLLIVITRPDPMVCFHELIPLASRPSQAPLRREFQGLLKRMRIPAALMKWVRCKILSRLRARHLL